MSEGGNKIEIHFNLLQINHKDLLVILPTTTLCAIWHVLAQDLPAALGLPPPPPSILQTMTIYGIACTDQCPPLHAHTAHIHKHSITKPALIS